MEIESKSGKVRKLVLHITASSKIKENLRDKAFEQIVGEVSKFKAFEFNAENDGTTPDYAGKKYYLVLNEPKNEKRVLRVIRKFNFEIIS